MNNLMKLNIIARKIHRILVVATVLLGLSMMTTGSLLKFPLFTLDYIMVRSVHNNLSTFFSAALFMMMVTGLFMYLFPYLNKQGRKSS